jgi:hypothetical protein
MTADIPRNLASALAFVLSIPAAAPRSASPVAIMTACGKPLFGPKIFKLD